MAEWEFQKITLSTVTRSGTSTLLPQWEQGPKHCVPWVPFWLQIKKMPHHDLLIIGAGSGNTIIGPEHDHLDIAIAEPAEFGGTCMNRGCIPSKMLVYAADLSMNAQTANKLGVKSSFSGVDWRAIQTCLLYTSPSPRDRG